MQEIADRELSNWTAKKAFSYVKWILDMSRDMGLTIGNKSRLIPKTHRIPKGVKTAHSQPYTSGADFVNILSKIERPRDQIILKILFLCAVRRSELFVFQMVRF
jgi:integrase